MVGLFRSSLKQYKIPSGFARISQDVLEGMYVYRAENILVNSYLLFCIPSRANLVLWLNCLLCRSLSPTLTLTVSKAFFSKKNHPFRPAV
jgi:hypothetical protein